MKAIDFGEDFYWGVSTSAYQIEGAHQAHNKGLSIWDVFSNTSRNIHQNHNGNIAADFYNRYREDILLLKSMGISHFRFSIAWSRILPNGTGSINEAGIQFYHNVIDACLENNITPWVTLYHWDLPHELEKKGGWVNRSILQWFKEYVDLCVTRFGTKIKHWMVLNEPIAFTGSGYFLGVHAPGKTGLANFFPAIHHASLCQNIGFYSIKDRYPESEVGTTFSFSHIEATVTAYPKQNARHIEAAKRVDVILNRMAIEPTLGLPYPYADFPVLGSIRNYMHTGDEKRLQTPFDFIGIQVYTREIVRYSLFVPYLKAKLISAERRKVPRTAINWEIHPPSIYEIIKKVAAYSGVKKMIITENGAAFNDVCSGNNVHDSYRIDYLKTHIVEVKRAKDEGINIAGYFVWSFIDNFEWSEGYYPRFGIVYVDFKTQQRIVKDSGVWYKTFLNLKE